jgi:hypothetical protein
MSNETKRAAVAAFCGEESPDELARAAGEKVVDALTAHVRAELAAPAPSAAAVEGEMGPDVWVRLPKTSGRVPQVFAREPDGVDSVRYTDARHLDALRSDLSETRRKLAEVTGERDEARRRLDESDDNHGETIAQRDHIEEVVEAIHACSGCEREATNLHNYGACALEWAAGNERLIAELRERDEKMQTDLAFDLCRTQLHDAIRAQNSAIEQRDAAVKAREEAEAKLAEREAALPHDAAVERDLRVRITELQTAIDAARVYRKEESVSLEEHNAKVAELEATILDARHHIVGCDSVSDEDEKTIAARDVAIEKLRAALADLLAHATAWSYAPAPEPLPLVDALIDAIDRARDALTDTASAPPSSGETRPTMASVAAHAKELSGRVDAAVAEYVPSPSATVELPSSGETKIPTVEQLMLTLGISGKAPYFAIVEWLMRRGGELPEASTTSSSGETTAGDDSPNFTPPELDALAGRGYERVNRTATARLGPAETSAAGTFAPLVLHPVRMTGRGADDLPLTCLLCHREADTPPLSEYEVTYLSLSGSTTAGLHERCYRRALGRRSEAARLDPTRTAQPLTELIARVPEGRNSVGVPAFGLAPVEWSGDLHSRLTDIVDDAFGPRPTAPIETLLSTLEDWAEKARREREADALRDRRTGEQTSLRPDVEHPDNELADRLVREGKAAMAGGGKRIPLGFATPETGAEADESSGDIRRYPCPSRTPAAPETAKEGRWGVWGPRASPFGGKLPDGWVTEEVPRSFATEAEAQECADDFDTKDGRYGWEPRALPPEAAPKETKP